MKTQTGAYRRAIFKHTYAVIYRIDADMLVFPDVYHTSRNKGNPETND
ncbi:hypothetical protein [Spirosoma koreense]